MWMEKLRQDFHLALIVMFGIVLNVMILPFAVYRFVEGQLLVGTIDVLIVMCVDIGVIRAHRHGSTAGVALFLVVVSSIGCIAISYVTGPAGPLWLYAVMLTSFLLVERKRAAIISAIGIAGVAASSLALPELAHKAAFVGSSVLVCSFAYIFSWRAEMQRNQLEVLALLDPLTAAGNRRGMNAEVGIAIAMSSRDGTQLGLIIFDLDHFKRINDRHGHDAGDDVLVQVANVVRATTRKSDRFFRFGGEEFALLVRDTTRGDLRDMAEKIRLAILRGVRCGDLIVTASFGASLLRKNESPTNWQARADAAMYRAKHEGRNRTVIDELMAVERAAELRHAKAANADVGTVATSPSRIIKSLDGRSALESARTLGARRLNNGIVEGRTPPARCTGKPGKN